MSITNSDIIAMRSRINENLKSPTRRKRIKQIKRKMEEQLTLTDFLASLL